MKYQCKCGHAKSSSKILLNICNKCYSDIDIKIEKEPLLDENYHLGLWVIADNEILGNNYNKAEQLLNRILIQLSEGTEEYNLVLRKLNELQN